MIEVIAVIRDIAIILGFLILVGVAIVVLKVVLDLARKAEDTRKFAVNVGTAVANPFIAVMRMVGGRKR